MSPACHLSLLSEWCHVDIDKVRLGANPMGQRGLLAAQDCPSGSTILVIPWKHVLGMRAARQLIEDETAKGRGMDDDDFFLKLILVCQGFEQRLWSCVMASAILAGLRYPLSPWSPFIACLPHPQSHLHDNNINININDNKNENRIEMALRRTHALTARQSAKRTSKRNNGNQKLSQSILQELRLVRMDIMSAPRTNDTALEHVLLWNNDALLETHDERLIQEVTRDTEWLACIWEQLFNNQPSRDNNNHDDNDDDNANGGNHTTESDKNITNSPPPDARPIVSLQSWMWAHAIVRSRAIGLDHAPNHIMTCNYNQCVFRSHGVLMPIIDLINHSSSSSSSSSNAALEIRSEGVAVVATEWIQKQAEVLFDYHPNATLSLLLRNYGFVDGSSLALSSHPCEQQQYQRQVLTTWNGMVQIDIAVTTLLATVGTTTTSSTMVRIESSEYQATTGKLFLVLRDGAEATVLPPKCFERWLALHRLAASSCFLLMEQFGKPQPGKNATAVSYRNATYQLLRRAYLDLSAVSNALLEF